ncbi:MaoC/PaaZ C-terminal domain-containing protein [Pannonibacter sp.]|uniref:MaoC/PaaZ C-terminal domain-containing protein n=1 Tax=Pannonibacter sp. TaxID=1906786 RepID=UPI003F721448
MPADIQTALTLARSAGGAALRRQPFHARAALLQSLADRLEERQTAYLSVGVHPARTVFARRLDLEAAVAALRSMARATLSILPNTTHLADGEPEQLAADGTFLGQHVLVSRRGVAVLLTGPDLPLSDLPLFDLAERIGATLLAGLPVLVLPGLPGAALAARFVRDALATGVLPDASLQLFSGPRQNVFCHLGSQDVVTFRGSAAEGRALRADPLLAAASARLLVEDCGTSTFVLGQDVGPADPLFAACVDRLRQVQVSSSRHGVICQVLVPAELAAALCEQLMKPLPASASDHPRSRVICLETLVDAAVLTRIEADGPVIALMAHGSQVSFADRLASLAPAAVAHVFAREVTLADSLCRSLAPRHRRVLCHDGSGVGIHLLQPARRPQPASASQGPDCLRDTSHPWQNPPDRAAPLPDYAHGETLVSLLRDYMQRSALQGSPEMLASVLGQWVPGAMRRDAQPHALAGSGAGIQPGDTIVTPARRITVADIENFAARTGDRFYAHMDHGAARSNPFFDGRVAHGFLVLSLSAGVLLATRQEARLDRFEIQSLRFSSPVYPGDDLHVVLTARQISRAIDGAFDQVWWDCAIVRGEGDAVARYDLRTSLRALATVPAQCPDAPAPTSAHGGVGGFLQDHAEG